STCSTTARKITNDDLMTCYGRADAILAHESIERQFVESRASNRFAPPRSPRHGRSLRATSLRSKWRSTKRSATKQHNTKYARSSSQSHNLWHNPRKRKVRKPVLARRYRDCRQCAYGTESLHVHRPRWQLHPSGPFNRTLRGPRPNAGIRRKHAGCPHQRDRLQRTSRYGFGSALPRPQATQL